jgi:hypothetical protein
VNGRNFTGTTDFGNVKARPPAGGFILFSGNEALLLLQRIYSIRDNGKGLVATFLFDKTLAALALGAALVVVGRLLGFFCRNFLAAAAAASATIAVGTAS